MISAGLSLDDWLARLETFSAQEIVLGLDRVQKILEKLKLPTPESVFHVAGTNGKGSSVAMLQSLLQQSGQRVGSYTSPHIVEYNERISVNGTHATDAQIIAAFERIDDVRGDIPLTYFEYGTLAALLIFADVNVAAAILEIGLGGRLDAVNAVEPDAGLITNISLDHCDWLGDNVESIGFEKAGIMRAGKPVVFASTAIPTSVLEYAASVEADLILCGRDYHYSMNDKGWSWQGRSHRLESLDLPPLRGEFQLANAAGVLALVEASGQHELLQKKIVDRAFRDLQIAGRMQSIEAGGHWLLDVAHNPAAAIALAQTLKANVQQGRTIAITGLLDDKDAEEVIGPLVDVVDHWIAVTANSPRAVEAGELARIIANLSNRACLVATSIDEAVSFARELAAANDQILVTGSFYVVGPVLDNLKLYSRRQS
jgi:dihydrofolate synthase/folylpolyglutamate synthase